MNDSTEDSGQEVSLKQLPLFTSDHGQRLVILPVNQLQDHPDNPRIYMLEEVIDAIAVQLAEKGFTIPHALRVRRFGGGYQIVSGHHRKLAAIKAGITEVPCWVEDLDNEEAFMQLLLDNTEEGFSPLEYGIHALRYVSLGGPGRGNEGGIRDYARRINKSRRYITELRDAAEVYTSVEENGRSSGHFRDKAKHLCALHALPRFCWFYCCDVLSREKMSVTDVEFAVGRVQDFLREFKPPREWTDYMPLHLCAARVFDGREGRLFARLLTLAEQVYADLNSDERTLDLAQTWRTWLIDHACGESWDIRLVQDERLRLEAIAWERKNPEEPEKTAVTLILADPPWRYDFSETDSRQIENQYASATVDQIISHLDLPQMPPIADECVLFLWATAPKLKEALEVMEGWGFTYKTQAVWVKGKIGMGYWFRGEHELLLVGTRGLANPPAEADRVSSVFFEDREGHSEKPECVYAWIERAFPLAEKLEMYARTPRLGWGSFGNEVTG